MTTVWVGAPQPRDAGGVTVEITVGFADEDRPDGCSDALYDVLRGVLFGRAEDIETLYLQLDANDRFDAIVFDGTYGGEQTWCCAAPQHHSRVVPAAKFETDPAGRPVLWVTTWNHLFCERNTNAGDAAMVYEDVPPDSYRVLRASRAEVNSTFTGFISSVA